MKLLKSEILTIPKCYFISNVDEIDKLPLGVPFIYGSPKDERRAIEVLEYEILLESLKQTGFKLNYSLLLKNIGKYEPKSKSLFKCIDIKVDNYVYDEDLSKETTLLDSPIVKQIIRDGVIVDLEVIKNLKLFPVWLTDLEEAIKVNLHNYCNYNPYMYNKKLGIVCGDYKVSSPKRNAIIIDISGSIPTSISYSILSLCKHMSINYYADLIITGSKTTLYEYDKVHTLDIDTIYYENGRDNDQEYFKELVSVYREYNNVIIFGDNHEPGRRWRNQYNIDTSIIDVIEGKTLCKWSVDKIISLHTVDNAILAGYGLWFSPLQIEHVKDWVKYLN